MFSFLYVNHRAIKLKNTVCGNWRSLRTLQMSALLSARFRSAQCHSLEASGFTTFLRIPNSSIRRQTSEPTKGQKPTASLLEFKSQLSCLLSGDLGKIT